MTDRLVLGWREWVALPELGVAAVLAKLDTGAHGSALHATGIELFGPEHDRQVRFHLHPLPDEPEITVACTAPLADRRAITSSNGGSELRPVIRTALRIGALTCEAEVSLTARPTMRHRMLLGRAALARLGVLVDPARVRATHPPTAELDRAP